MTRPRDDLFVLFRRYCSVRGLSDKQQEFGIWLIQRFLFPQEYDLTTIGDRRLGMLAELGKEFTFTPGHQASTPRARQYGILKYIYVLEEGLVDYALVLGGNANQHTEDARLKRARKRLFDAIRRCI